MNQQLIEYIASVKKQGYSHKQIKQHLLSNGYTKEQIDEAMTHFKSFPYWVLIIPAAAIVAAAVFFLWPRSMTCEGVSLEIHELNGQQVICAYPDHSQIQLILKNTGLPIDGFEVRVDGHTKERVEGPFTENQIITKVLPLTKHEAESVTIIPYTDNMCGGNKIQISPLETC